MYVRWRQVYGLCKPGETKQLCGGKKPGWVEGLWDGFEPVVEETSDERIDLAGFLDLRGVAAVGEDYLAGVWHPGGGADGAGHVGDHVVLGAPDGEAWVGNLLQET